MITATRIALAILLLGLFTFFGVNHSTDESKIAPYHHPVFYNSNNLGHEIALSENQLRTNPDGPLLLTQLASLYAKQGKQSADYALLKKANLLAIRSYAQLTFFNDGAKVVMADVAQAQHEFKKSIRLAKEIIHNPYTRTGSKIDALSLLVTSCLAIGDLDGAENYSTRLVQMRPAVGSHLQRALVLNAQEKKAGALIEFKTAYNLELFGNPEEAAYLRALWGRSYQQQGQSQEAQDLFREALRILPNYHLALGLLAQSELEQNHLSDAEIHYREAFTFSKQLVYLLGSAHVKEHQGKHEIALQYQNEVEKIIRIEMTASNYGHRAELIQLLLDRNQLGDASEAFKLARAELALRPNSEIRKIYVEAERAALASSRQLARTMSPRLTSQ